MTNTNKDLGKELGKQIDIIKEAQAEMETDIRENLKVRDKRDLLVKASLDGEIDRLTKQKEIVKRQNDEGEDFTYDDYIDLVKTDTIYTATSYYIGQHMEDDNLDKDRELINTIYDEATLDDAIYQLNLVKELKHLNENMKPQVYVRTPSEIKSKINRTMSKIDKKSNDESHSTIRQLGIDIGSLYSFLRQMAPNSDVKHRKFIYSFCQYVDKYYNDLPLTVMHTIKAIEFLQFGTRADQNKGIVDGLNLIYESL